jgi:cyclase
MILDVATAARADGKTPLEAARDVELGEFASLTDNERLVGNLYRAMAELDGPEANADMSIAAAIGDMITFHGGPLLPCSA